MTQAFQASITGSRGSAGIRRNPDAQNSRPQVLKQLYEGTHLIRVGHVKRTRVHPTTAAGASSHGQNAQTMFTSSMAKLSAMLGNLNHQKIRKRKNRQNEAN